MPTWTKEQLEAIDKDGSNIIVSAGAGSGKTAVLSERVLRKLKQGVNINELLILTFTNAAAAEMKDRIRKKIKKEPTLIKQLDYIDNAYITTFDSYALSLVKKYNYLLNVSKNINIVDSGIMLQKENEILDSIFEDLYAKKDDKFIKLINDFCIKDDLVIKTSIKNINKSLNLKSDKYEYLDSLISNSYNEERVLNLIKEYEKIILNKIQIISDNLDMISMTEFPEYYEELMSNLEPLLRSKYYDEFVKYSELSLPRKPKNSETISTYKNNIDKNLKQIKELLKYKNEDEIKESFYSTKDYVQCIIDIIKIYDNKIKSFKEENDTYEFNDIAIMSIRLLKENDDIKEEIKKSYNEIMVDEYQDTSDLQEDFINLIANDNVYMVGDIKQSIYGFRNANPNNFKNKYNQYAKNNGGIKIDLLKNFRSRSEVLDGINLIFDLIMTNDIGGANYQESHRMQFGNNAYLAENTNYNNSLEILNYNNKDKKYSNEEIEAFTIAKDIKEKISSQYLVMDKNTLKLRKANYSDFCIIMDRGSSFNTYKKIFEYLNIPMAVWNDSKLTDEIDIMIINNIIGLILNIYNNEFNTDFKYNFTSVARSFLFEMPDEEIFEIIKNNNYKNTRLYEICTEVSEKIYYLSNEELLYEIIDKFNYYEKIILIGNVEDSLIKIDNIIDIAKNLSKIGYTIVMFKKYLDDMINDKDYEIKYSMNDLSDDSVTIMNIHKSKGLEFPICYFSGYYKTFNKDDLKSKFLFDKDYGIVTPYFKEGIGETIIKSLIKEKYDINNISERIRLFYVALTRCREKMIIISPLAEEETNFISNYVDDNIRVSCNSFLDIMNSIKYNLKDYIKNINLDTLGLTKDYNIFKKMDYQKIINKNDIKINNQEIIKNNNTVDNKHASKIIKDLIPRETKELLEFGSNIHYIFELEDFNNPENEYVKKLVSLLGDLSKSKIYKEHEFIFEENETEYHGIIDLMIEDDNCIKIIDYKLKNIDDEKYNKQLKVYKKYIMTKSNKQISTYLYSILDNKLVERNVI